MVGTVKIAYENIVESVFTMKIKEQISVLVAEKYVCGKCTLQKKSVCKLQLLLPFTIS